MNSLQTDHSTLSESSVYQIPSQNLDQNTIPQRTALTLPHPLGVEATLQHAVWGEERGYDDLWFADAGGIDALSTAVAAATLTSRVRIGIAIVPVYTRTPAVLAASAHVLNKVSNGRFILGLGSSSHVLMEGWNGQKLEKPLTRVRETTQLVKQILAGEKTSFQGETVRSHGYRQAPLESGSQPVYIAALRGKMLEMAAEVGDGVIINLYPQDVLPKIMKHIKIGAERAGKKLSDIEVVCRHNVMVTNDKQKARDAFRASHSPYYATPVYNKFLAWAGYPEVADTINEGWAAKDRKKTCGALEDKLIDNICIIGSAEECQDRIRQYAEGGVTTHIISTSLPESMDATFEAFTKENFSF
jgi:probable F420-dependent oxidoreductase